MRGTKCSWVIALAVLVGCDSATATRDPLRATDQSGIAAMNGTVGSTSGGGKAQLPPGFSALSFSFTAGLKSDGRATGQFRQFYESEGLTVDFAGEVTCVSFDPVTNRAWIGGVVTRNSSTEPAVRQPQHDVGRDVWFRVVDNGEAQSPDDRTTVFGFEPGPGGIITSAEYCERQLWTANDANTWAVTEGNIQVRP